MTLIDVYLWNRFPTDAVALGVDRQFLWGPSLLISPVLDEVSYYIIILIS